MGLDPAMCDRLTDAVLRGRGDLGKVLAELKPDPAALAAWAHGIGPRQAVAATRRLADAQAQVALSHMRVHMVHRLAELALSNNVPPETSRKAATTLLAADLTKVAAAVPNAQEEMDPYQRLEALWKLPPEEEGEEKQPPSGDHPPSGDGGL